MSDFNPNGVGVENGNIFGFPVKEKEADVVLIPVPWDATTSYHTGTSNGPLAILKASTQLDFYHPNVKNAWEQKIWMLPVSEDWTTLSQEFGADMALYHEVLEMGQPLTQGLKDLVKDVTKAQKFLTKNIKSKSFELLDQGKVVGIVGGEHSAPLGLINALSERYKDFGILQIDAHADLRKSYEGLKQSHASIMFNSLKNKSLSRLVQVGVRDVCPEEIDLIEKDQRIKTFFDWDMKEQLFSGVLWKDLVKKIISSLPKNVYISFDIDGLNPSLCPNTGTPVPGGLTFEQARYLLIELARSKKKIIGFDLCEVGVGNDDFDANIGARVLWELCTSIKINQQKVSE
jgi:agmatinase